MKNIEISSHLTLSDDQKARFASMVYEHQRFDHENGFVTRSGEVRTLARIHFVLEPLEGIYGGYSDICGFDDVSFGDKTAFVYLEDEAGKMIGWRDAQQNITSEWHHGIVLKDDEGDTWFCGRNTYSKDDLTGQEDLFRISNTTTAQVLRANGEISDNLPADGEFMLSRESDRKITSIPWWGNMNPEDPHVLPEARDRMRSVLDIIKGRIADLKLGSPTP